jgi:DNA polymerase-3 subunit epsilon
MRQVFLDTETTGLNAEKGDRIIEIGCIEMVEPPPHRRHLHLYLNPRAPATPTRCGARPDRRVPGRQAAVRRVADELLAFLAGAELVIHNAPSTSASRRRVRAPGPPHAGRRVAAASPTAC